MNIRPQLGLGIALAIGSASCGGPTSDFPVTGGMVDAGVGGTGSSPPPSTGGTNGGSTGGGSNFGDIDAGNDMDAGVDMDGGSEPDAGPDDDAGAYTGG